MAAVATDGGGTEAESVKELEDVEEMTGGTDGEGNEDTTTMDVVVGSIMDVTTFGVASDTGVLGSPEARREPHESEEV